MSRGNNHSPPSDVTKLTQRIERWRRERIKRSPMPGDLWTAATRLAQRYGVSMIARELRVGYASLKDKVELAQKCDGGSQSPGAGVVAPGFARDCFAELSGAQLLDHSSKAAVVELATADGVRLTVRFDDGGQLDVVGLVRAFRA